MEIFRKEVIKGNPTPVVDVIYYIVEENGRPVLTVVLGEECRVSEDHPQPLRDEEGFAGFKGSNLTELYRDMYTFDIWDPKYGSKVSYLAIDGIFGMDMNSLRPIETTSSTPESYVFDGRKIRALVCEQAFIRFPLRFTVNNKPCSLEVVRGVGDFQERAVQFVLTTHEGEVKLPITDLAVKPTQLVTCIRELLRGYAVTNVEQNEFDSRGKRPFLLIDHQVHSIRSSGVEMLLETSGGKDGEYRLEKPWVQQPGTLRIQGVMSGSKMDMAINYTSEDELDLDGFILDAIVKYYDTVAKGPDLTPGLLSRVHGHWIAGWNKMITENPILESKEKVYDAREESSISMESLRVNADYQELTILAGVFVHKPTGEVYNTWTGENAKSLFEEEIPLILIERWLGNDKNEVRIPYKTILSDTLD